MAHLKDNRVKDNRTGEQGNVLFLILIAVVLFAALSYAVTQSSRSGGGDAGSETSLVNSAQITQYPAGVRTAIIRQIVSKNVTAAQLSFNSPSDFGACTGAVLDTCVFLPTGGGATYVPGPAEVVTDGTPKPWVFNGENEITQVGTTVGSDNPSATSAEVIAFLPNVKDAVCKKIDVQLGIIAATGTIPAETGIDVTTQKLNGIGMVSGSSGGTIGSNTIPPGVNALNGQAFGCFSMGGHNYYYHVLIEQ